MKDYTYIVKRLTGVYRVKYKDKVGYLFSAILSDSEGEGKIIFIASDGSSWNKLCDADEPEYAAEHCVYTHDKPMPLDNVRILFNFIDWNDVPHTRASAYFLKYTKPT